jgi:hypothetical protein
MKRALPRIIGMTAKRTYELVRLQYIKVAEYQRRGAVHFHALIRLDAAPLDDEAPIAPPPEPFTVEVLEEAVRQAWTSAKAPCLPLDGIAEPYARWGRPDIQRLRGGGAAELTAEAVMGYVAKYATKSSESLGGGLAHPVSEATLDDLDAPPHVARAVRTAWELGGLPGLKQLRLRKWAHCLGFGGHFLTKSRRFSTTFTERRQNRTEHARRRRFADGVPLDAWGRPEDDDQVAILADWSYQGSGYRTQGEKWLALSAAARAREREQAAREELAEIRRRAS